MFFILNRVLWWHGEFISLHSTTLQISQSPLSNNRSERKGETEKTAANLIHKQRLQLIYIWK